MKKKDEYMDIAGAGEEDNTKTNGGSPTGSVNGDDPSKKTGNEAEYLSVGAASQTNKNRNQNENGAANGRGHAATSSSGSNDYKTGHEDIETGTDNSRAIVLATQTAFAPKSAWHIFYYSAVTLAALGVAGLAFTSGGIYADDTASSVFHLPEATIELWAILSAVPPGAALSSFALASNIYDTIRLALNYKSWSGLAAILTLGLSRRVGDKNFVEFSRWGYFAHFLSQLCIVIPGAAIAALPSAHAAFSVLTGKDMNWSLSRARFFANSSFTSAVSTNTRFLTLKLDDFIAWVNRKTSSASQTKRDTALAILRYYLNHQFKQHALDRKRALLRQIVDANGDLSKCLQIAVNNLNGTEDIFNIQPLSVKDFSKNTIKNFAYGLAAILGAIYCLPNIASGLDASALSTDLLRKMFTESAPTFFTIPGWLIAMASVIFNLPINVPAALILMGAIFSAEYSKRSMMNLLCASVLPNAIAATQFFMKPAVNFVETLVLTVFLASLMMANIAWNAISKNGVGFENIARLYCAAFFSLSFAFGQAGLLLQFPLDIPVSLNHSVFVATIFAATALGYMSISKRFNSWVNGARETVDAVLNWRKTKNADEVDNLSDAQVSARLGTIFTDAEYQLAHCRTEQADAVFDAANGNLLKLPASEDLNEKSPLITTQQKALENRESELKQYQKKGYLEAVWDRLPSRESWRASLFNPRNWRSEETGYCGLSRPRVTVTYSLIR